MTQQQTQPTQDAVERVDVIPTFHNVCGSRTIRQMCHCHKCDALNTESAVVHARHDARHPIQPNERSMSDLINKALIFATEAHASVNQVRKYTGEPYITHPIEVMMIVREHGGTEEMQVAALLHDVVEDTPVTLNDVEREFGMVVATIVDGMTGNETGNRSQRKAAACDRLGAASAEVQTIKLADLISNTRTIVARDPKFAKVYLQEKAALLKFLSKGSADLHTVAWDMVHAGMQEIGAIAALSTSPCPNCDAIATESAVVHGHGCPVAEVEAGKRCPCCNGPVTIIHAPLKTVRYTDEWGNDAVTTHLATESYHHCESDELITLREHVAVLRDALTSAVGHIEHMAAWVTDQRKGYNFEAMGEDMTSIRAAIAKIEGDAP